MSESTLSLNRNDLLRHVGRYLSGIRDATTLEAEQRVDLDDVVNIGCRMAYFPPILPGEPHSHSWSFLRPVLQNFTVHAPYATGTITVASGVATLAGGTWPTWAAEGSIEVDQVGFTVATRTSNSQVILDDLSINYAAGTEYGLAHIDIQLPDLFGGFSSDLVLTNNNRVYGVPLQRTSMENILAYRQLSVTTSFPSAYAVQSLFTTGATPQRWAMSIWPSPDSAYTITGRFDINPDALTTALPYPRGGLPFAECLREACLAAAESEIEGEAGIHTQKFETALRSAISHDRRMSNAGILGTMNNGKVSRQSPWGEIRGWQRQNAIGQPVGYN